jgi:predicted Zn-dependent protease
MAGLAYAVLRGYRGDVHDFEAHCDAAVGLSPLDPAIFVYRSIQASAKISANRPVDAAEAASAAIRSNAAYATAHLMMTIALAMQDKLDEARRSAQRVLRLEPEFAVGRYLTEFGGRRPPDAEGRASALLAAGLPP